MKEKAIKILAITLAVLMTTITLIAWVSLWVYVFTTVVDFLLVMSLIMFVIIHGALTVPLWDYVIKSMKKSKSSY